jgi:heme oxygenase (biliverdin-IX-beta and delta-forming)
MQPLLSHLRDATRASHEKLDAAFGSLQMAQRDDYVRFLSGHAIGLAPMFAAFCSFVEKDLGLACPDYPAMLRDDLAKLDINADALPRVPVQGDLSPAAIGYVVSGSRLGLTVIGRAGYWGRENGLPSSYMEDTQGLTVWKATAAHLKQQELSDEAAAPERAAAIAAFDTFRAAFDASATALVR